MSDLDENTENQTPKKGKSRKSGEWKAAFIACLRNSANVRASCQAAGVRRTDAYKARDKDKKFASEWDEALQDALDILEAEMMKRAKSGSDTLMIFLMKAHRPEKYRDVYRTELTGKNGGAVKVQSGLSPEFAAALNKIYGDKGDGNG